REPRVPVVRLHLALQHCNRVRTEAGVERFHQPERCDVLGDVDMADHPQRVDTAVGAAGAVHGHRLAGDFKHRAFHRRLHRRAVVLALQAHEGTAVEFEGESEAGHNLGLSSLRTAAGVAATRSWGAYGSGLLSFAPNDEWGDITSAPSPP